MARGRPYGGMRSLGQQVPPHTKMSGMRPGTGDSHLGSHACREGDRARRICRVCVSWSPQWPLPCHFVWLLVRPVAVLKFRHVGDAGVTPRGLYSGSSRSLDLPMSLGGGGPWRRGCGRSTGRFKRSARRCGGKQRPTRRRAPAGTSRPRSFGAPSP